MTVLAIANPNPEYMYYRNLKEITLQATINNDHVTFYEIGPSRYVPVKEEIVQQMFPQEVSLHDMPFMINGNEEFYCVVMRNDPAYADKFKALKEKKCVSAFTRTKKSVFSRTK